MLILFVLTRFNLYCSASQTPPAGSDSESSILTVSIPSLCPGLRVVDWPCPPGVPIEVNLPWLRTADGPDRLHFA
jgi:hypothetical protein